jgi:hypothetical protein
MFRVFTFLPGTISLMWASQKSGLSIYHARNLVDSSSLRDFKLCIKPGPDNPNCFGLIGLLLVHTVRVFFLLTPVKKKNHCVSKTILFFFLVSIFIITQRSKTRIDLQMN